MGVNAAFNRTYFWFGSKGSSSQGTLAWRLGSAIASHTHVAAEVWDLVCQADNPDSGTICFPFVSARGMPFSLIDCHIEQVEYKYEYGKTHYGKGVF